MPDRREQGGWIRSSRRIRSKYRIRSRSKIKSIGIFRSSGTLDSRDKQKGTEGTFFSEFKFIVCFLWGLHRLLGDFESQK